MKREIKKQYYIAYEKGSKRGYVAFAPSIPGCAVYGSTLKEAYTNTGIAVKECLEVIHEFNKKSPKETLTPQIIKKFNFVKVL